MKIGRLITNDGIEFSLESSQLKELSEYLAQQEINEALAADAGSVLDPEEYERAVQAVYLVHPGNTDRVQISF